MDNVYGHEHAKRALRVMVKRSQERYYNREVMGRATNTAPLKILLVGPSGTGKTHLMSSLKRQHNLPCLMLDATQFTPTGSNGGISAIKLREMIRATANEHMKQPGYHSIPGVLSQMVIFVDEFDKLGTRHDSSGNWNTHVQSNFLTLIDDKEEFAGLSWVFAGAFSHLHVKETKNHIGFGKAGAEEAVKAITDADILRSGIIPELLGRISLVCQLDIFTEQDYMTVLTEKLLPLYSNLSELSPDKLNEMAKTAMGSGLGIRSLTRQLEHLSIEQEDMLCVTYRP